MKCGQPQIENGYHCCGVHLEDVQAVGEVVVQVGHEEGRAFHPIQVEAVHPQAESALFARIARVVLHHL